MLSSLLSRPILIGFFAGISINLLVGQIGRVTGVGITSKGLFPPIMELLDKRSAVDIPSVLDASAMPLVDSTGAEVLKDICRQLGQRNIHMGIADLYQEPKGLLERAGLFSETGHPVIFDDLEDAIDAGGNSPGMQ